MMQSAPFTPRRTFLLVARFFLGGIFIYAGYSKALQPNMLYWPLPLLKFSIAANLSNFAQQVESFKMLPPAGVDFVSHVLPFVELLLGILLIVGWRLRIWGAIASL